MSQIVNTVEARKNLAELVNKVAYGEDSIILTRRGKQVAALISMEEFELLHRLEDLIDIQEAKKALATPEKSISHEEFWKELGIE